ncbi:19295_t:CDS:2, partial [Cetraspora pellucida]
FGRLVTHTLEAVLTVLFIDAIYFKSLYKVAVFRICKDAFSHQVII